MVEFPEKDDLVIIKVNKVMQYGAFCSLLEYPGIEGFLHIREVASKWIKNINDYVKPGMQTVARVIDVEKHKNVVDLSLRSVSEDMKRKRLEEYQNEKKARKIIEVAYKKANTKLSEDVFENIKKEYDSLYDLLLDIQEEEQIAEEFFPKKVASLIVEMVRSMIKKPVIEIRAIAKVIIPETNGVEKIKKGFSKVKAETLYLGSGKYMIKLEGEDYKKTSKKMRTIEEKLRDEFGKSLISFERVEKK